MRQMIYDQDSPKWLEHICQLVDQYFKQEAPVVQYEYAKDLVEKLDLELRKQGVDDSTLKKDLNDFLHYSVRTSHPNFHNQLYGGFNLWAFFGEILTALTSTSMATFEIAPVATLMEQTLVNKMSALIGFRANQNEVGEGIMLTGGSNANMVAMLAARNCAFPESKTQGAKSGLIAFCSKEAHYSFSKAANILGLGTDNLWQVESDDQGAMLASDLEKQIEKAKSLGLTPYFVGATAGTTVKGAFDPFEAIAKICQGHNLWFHVDGAWGGSVALSPTHRKLLKGAELADSFTWDAHKLMHIPLIASFILFKKAGTLKHSHGGGGDTYIFHEYDNKNWDTGPSSLQCGRRVDALKVWLSWRALGDDGYAKVIDQHFEIAAKVEQEIKLRPQFKLMFKRHFLNICFQVNSPNGESQKDFNITLRNKIIKQGKFLVNFSWQGDEPFFRLIVANPASSVDDYLALLDELIAISH
tara:strand:+ start:10065 stop:11474 length:1410 start_codon:yes stop_codon:yes gene_type:complete